MSENSKWEVKDNKVKIGTEWKSAKQLRNSFIITVIVAIILGVLTIYMFTIHLLAGLLALIACGGAMLVSMGSVDALSALDEKLIPKSNFNSKEYMSKVKENVGLIKNKAKAKVQKNGDENTVAVVEEPTEVQTTINIDVDATVIIEKTNLVGNTDEERQKLIAGLHALDTLQLTNTFGVVDEKDNYIGKLNKRMIQQIKASDINFESLYVKVIEILSSKDGKFIVSVSVIKK